MIFRDLLEKLIRGENVTSDEAAEAMDTIACGKADPVQIGAFLTLLRVKGETVDEIIGIVRVMIKHAVVINIQSITLDIVGTGGDGANTVNISTGAAILAAACGARVAKHGNRSVSSRSGSADVLDALGIPMLHPEAIAPCLYEANITFMYSPHFHPAMKHVVPVRRSIGIRTIFNILGPLLNPARCKRMMVGVYSPELLVPYGQVLFDLGVEHALIIHCQGLDELNFMGIADIMEVTQEKGCVASTFDPSELCINKTSLKDLKGGDAEYNANILKTIFMGGEECENPIGETISLNAGAGLYIYGLAKSIIDGYKIAKKILKSGAAKTTLENWIRVSQRLHH